MDPLNDLIGVVFIVVVLSSISWQINLITLSQFNQFNTGLQNFLPTWSDLEINLILFKVLVYPDSDFYQ